MSIAKNDDGSVTVTLAFPIKHDGQDLDKVTLRRPKAKDFRLMGKQSGTDVDKSLWLIGALSGLPSGSTDQIDAADMAEFGEVIEGFTKGS